jgi:two-component system NarL family response regulator
VDAGAYHSNGDRAAEQRDGLRVVVADPSRAFAEGVTALLRNAGIAAQPSGLDALIEICEADPVSVLVIDGGAAQRMPIDELARLRERPPGCQLLLIVGDAGCGADQMVEATGAATWLSRHSQPSELIRTVQALLERRTMGRKLLPRATQTANSKVPLVQLTDREAAVLRLLVQGLNNDTIGQVLDVSPNTVRTHVRNVLLKLNAHSRVEAIAMAAQPGLLTGPAVVTEAVV